MTVAAALARIWRQEDVNFLLTNRIPRRLATRLFARLSRIEQPLLTRAAIALWRRCGDLDLSDAREQDFTSLHACFTRALKPGARPTDSDPRVLTSPCDAIVGASGVIAAGALLQAKGLTYTLAELVGDAALTQLHADGLFVTLRLTAGMYHRFHAPYDCTVRGVRYISGDTWNVNPVAVQRIARLFCKNERAVIETALSGIGATVTLVPVAAILVASIRLHCLGASLSMAYRGASEIPCRAAYRKGEELGWFEHGSTIILLAPKGFTLCQTVREGARIRTGQPLVRLP